MAHVVVHVIIQIDFYYFWRENIIFSYSLPSFLSLQTLSSAMVGSIVGMQSSEILQVASEYEVKVCVYTYT